MITLTDNSRIFVSTKAVDMRKAIDGLSVLVADVMEAQPQSGDVYIFWNRSRDKVKALYWDRNGFVMHYKRLEKGKFKFSKSLSEKPLEITSNQLSWLLAGLDFMLMEKFGELNYDNYY